MIHDVKKWIYEPCLLIVPVLHNWVERKLKPVSKILTKLTWPESAETDDMNAMRKRESYEPEQVI